jgi:NDP-sugar pyrophosphorylase family protein
MSIAPTTAVLLAAGRGRRLRPHTDDTPKPLLPVDGRPLLDYVLTAVASAGIRTACVVTHHLGEQIEQFVGDGSAWGLTALFCRQSRLAGTAHALQAAAAAHPSLFVEPRPFLLSATDYVLPPAYLQALITAHISYGTDITISLKRLPPSEISESSSVVIQPDGHIARIVEKPPPDTDAGPLAASLIFILPGDAVNYLPTMTRSPRGEFEIQDIVNQMLQEGYAARGLVQERPREWSSW